MAKEVVNEEDQIVIVTMSTKDYTVLKGMIEERRTLNVVMKWVKGFGLVVGATFLGIMQFGSELKHFLNRLFE